MDRAIRISVLVCRLAPVAAASGTNGVVNPNLSRTPREQEKVTMNILEKLTDLGQSLWMDNIQRKLLENGETKAMIARGDIRGMTSNPTIFDKAIAKTTDYDEALVPLSWAGWSAEKIFWELVVEDIRSATDL